MKFYKFLWVVSCGIPAFLEFVVLGIISAVTIIGIPFAKMWFTFAKLIINPFDKEIDISFSAHKFLNALWLMSIGWMFVFMFYLGGIIFCATIILLPFGKQCMKLGKYCASPFGADIS